MTQSTEFTAQGLPQLAGDLPLSLPQENVWFLQKLEPDNRAYHFQPTLRFYGELDKETLQRSLDWGVSWAPVYSSPTGTLRVAAARNDFSAFVWKAWQDNTGALYAAPSGDAGQTYVHGTVLVFAGAATQFIGLTVLPKGQPLILFQTYISVGDHWDVSGYFSPDLGLTWIAA